MAMSPRSRTSNPSVQFPTHRRRRLKSPRVSQGCFMSPSVVFSDHLASNLGSPFLTVPDLPDALAPLDLDLIDGTLSAVPHAYTITRPASPDFSIIDPPSPSLSQLELIDVFAGSHSPRLISRRLRSGASGSSWAQTPAHSPLRTILPRLWDALSSPAKKANLKAKIAVRFAHDVEPEIVDGELQPLDGEEGEWIDDEACFIDARAVTGIDILSALPPELSLHLLSFLDLHSIMTCLAVCKAWRVLAGDNSVWRSLFERMICRGWNVDLTRVHKKAIRNDLDWLSKERNERGTSMARLSLAFEEWSRRRLTSQTHALVQRYSTAEPARIRADAARSPLALNWRHLYKTRYILDQRWSAVPNSHIPTSGHLGAKENVYEPSLNWLWGHTDSVYCLEFDSRYIISGSRDRSIKVWELYSGRCVATFVGGTSGHKGSVLCLKFEHDWHRRKPKGSRGFMVSGSSDCSIFVWDIWVDERENGQVKAEVRKVLKGHTGGVLDLRICDKWIVSCSKDARILVWNRKTLELHCTFRGHEGPVNAVGMEGRKVVSASGDGKMMLWDIPDVDGDGEVVANGPLRVFEGHDRGLACIEFKDDLIVSGSNDCKIKVWRASTGECLRTLTGHGLLVRALSFDPKSGRLVSASYDKTVVVWDLRTGRMEREFRGYHASHIFDVKFDVGRIVSTSHDRGIAILDFTDDLDTFLFV